MNQFLASTAAEKRSAIPTLDYLPAEAAQDRREDFENFLAAVPDGEVAETDRVE